ncbi:MAG: hypothetical protein MJE63_04950 [Proteobacteria bacterium]|nr:hypothetical protein [Pseudomonadota bacterium]
MEFQLIKYKWSKFKDKSLENLEDFNPDFIFTSSELFKGIEEMESFFQSYQPMNIVGYPGLILVEHKPERFIRQYFRAHPYSDIQFRQFPRLKITDPDLIFFDSSEIAPREIYPLPEIHFKEEKEIFLDREKLIGFSPWKDIATLYWKEKHYTPYQFCQLFDQTYENDSSTKHSKGILFDCGRMYISPGFFLRDIANLETLSLPIVHIISYQQVKKHYLDLDSLCFKLLETAKHRCSLKFNENYLQDEVAIKSHVPVTISSDSALTCTVINQLMQADGYARTVTADQADDSANRFLVSLNMEPVENTPFTFSIILDKLPIENATSDETGVIEPLTQLELEDIADPVMLQKRSNQVTKRLQKLKDQMKVLASSKAESDKNRYIDMLSRNKMEFINNLLEISETWDEQNCDVAVARQENVLVLYDDEKQALAIEEQLQRNERKTFLNAAQQFFDFESLVDLNIGPLEPFLHDGVVICCMTTKAILLRKFQQFEKELAQRKYPPLDKAISNLESEISKCEERAGRMKILDYSSYLRELYLENKEALFSAVKNYFKEVEKTRYLIKNQGAVYIIGDEEDNCDKIASAVKMAYGDSKNIVVRKVPTELNLFYGDLADQTETDEESFRSDLIDMNVNELSRFYRDIALSIGLRDVEIFFLAGDPQLNQLLIEFLRQKGSKYINTPIVLLASGVFNYQLMNGLSREGVKVLYQDQLLRDNPEALAKTFKTIV